MLVSTSPRSTPRPEVALAWGSQSTTSTLRPMSASAAPRLSVVVVLPTPPFWLATAMVRVGTTAALCGQPTGERSGASLQGFPQVIHGCARHFEAETHQGCGTLGKTLGQEVRAVSRETAAAAFGGVFHVKRHAQVPRRWSRITPS